MTLMTVSHSQARNFEYSDPSWKHYYYILIVIIIIIIIIVIIIIIIIIIIVIIIIAFLNSVCFKCCY